MTTEATSSTPEVSRQAAELEAMLRMLDLSSGSFSLSIAVCNSPALRNHIIEKLKQSRPNIQVVEIPAGITDVLEYIQQETDTPKCSAIFVTGLEKLLSSSEEKHPVLRSINASRELWERELQCPVVIWLPEYAAGLLSREAPDFWRYRSHRFEFVSEQAELPAGMQDYTSGNTSIASNLSADEKHFRIAELEQRIKEAGIEPDKRLKAYVAVWLRELAFLWRSLGESVTAEKTYHRSLAIMKELDYKAGLAHVYGDLGALYRIRGDLDAAQEMYRRSVVLAEELGDKRELAAAYGNFGVLCFSCGDLETAEEMYHKSLAIAEELGDKNGLASIYCNLGALCRIRGNRNSAEEMHERSIMCAAEVDDKEVLAANYGNLGLLYRDRGDLDAADEMFRKALELYSEIGAKLEIEKTENLLSELKAAQKAR